MLKLRLKNLFFGSSGIEDGLLGGKNGGGVSILLDLYDMATGM